MTVKITKLNKEDVPEEFIEYSRIAEEMNIMIEDDPTKEHQIRKVLSFGFKKEGNTKRNFAIVEIDERFFQQTMIRILNKEKLKNTREN